MKITVKDLSDCPFRNEDTVEYSEYTVDKEETHTVHMGTRDAHFIRVVR